MSRAVADVKFSGMSAPSVADASAILDSSDDVRIPRTIAQLRYSVKHLHAFWYVHLGPAHPLTARIQEYHRALISREALLELVVPRKCSQGAVTCPIGTSLTHRLPSVDVGPGTQRLPPADSRLDRSLRRYSPQERLGTRSPDRVLPVGVSGTLFCPSKCRRAFGLNGSHSKHRRHRIRGNYQSE
jgi:hypothetical protein